LFADFRAQVGIGHGGDLFFDGAQFFGKLTT
jgi:hypothetical protein